MKLYQSQAFLKNRYIKENRTLKEIAAECKCSIQTIKNHLDKFGLSK